MFKCNKPDLQMNIHTWLENKATEIAASVKEQAVKEGLISEEQSLNCKFELLQKGRRGRMPQENVYPDQPTMAEAKRILAGNWTPIYRTILLKLLEQNPRPEKVEGEPWWWSSNYQAFINNSLRAGNFPWRVIGTGDWDKRMIYLGTINNNGKVPVGKVRHYPNSTRNIFPFASPININKLAAQ
jgi:hypothetical protein